MIDRSSPAWAAVQAWAEHRQREADTMLKTQGLGPTETEAARSAWWLLEGLLRLPEMIAEIERRAEVPRPVDDYGLGDDPA